MKTTISKFVVLFTTALVFAACGDKDEAAPMQTAMEPSASTQPSDSCELNIVAPDSETDISEVPWQVALVEEDVHFCGGAIIDESWVLTALHCVLIEDPASIRVRAGITKLSDSSGPDVQEREIQEIFEYPYGFEGGTAEGDIALLQLATPLDLNDTTVQAIAIATPEDEQFFPPGTPATASGWGNTIGDLEPIEDCEARETPDVLRATSIPLISSRTAAEYTSAALERFGPDLLDRINDGSEDIDLDDLDQVNRITLGMISTADDELGLSTCFGDSGGPLAVDSPGGPLLVGIVSWGLLCGVANVPSVYVRVSWFSDWISSTMDSGSAEFDTSDRSCVSLDSCEGVTPSGCSCDVSCEQTGDCCFDYNLACTDDPFDARDFF